MKKNRLFGLVVVLGVLMGFFGQSLTFAVDSSGIETVMRKYQNKYHYVAIVGDYSWKFLGWPSHNCTAAPSYPSGFYGDITEAKATELVNNIVSQFYRGTDSAIYTHFILNPEGNESIEDITVAEPNSTDSWQSKLAQVDSDLNKLTIYNAGSPSYIDIVSKSGDGYDVPVIEGTGCNWSMTSNGSFTDAASMAASEWENSASACMNIGVAVWSSKCHSEGVDECNRSYSFDSYSANVKTYNGKYQLDLSKHNGSAACYLRIGQYNNHQYCGYVDGTDGVIYNPVNADEKFHSWDSPSTGSVWTSDYLFSEEMPTIPSPSRTVSGMCTEYKVISKAWEVSQSAVSVVPSFSTESDPVLSCSVPTELVYKDRDDHTVYSAGDGCGYETGETVKGRILINGYDPNVGMSLEVKLNSGFSSEVATLQIDSTTISSTNTQTVYCFTPQEDTSTGQWYVPFSISAKMGEDSVSFSIATVYSAQIGGTDANVAARMKTYRGEGEDVSFQIKTNGYECCNRKDSVNEGNTKPQITKHENGDVEIYFPDIEQSYIWGSYTEYIGMYYSKTCVFIEESVSDYDTDEILVSNGGSNGLVYNASSNWGTSGSAGSASFDREIDDNGNTVSSATYDTSGRLSKVAQAVNPTNLYRQFYYGDTGYPNRVTSYTDIAGNLSRTYTVVYDEATGKASGTIGGSGSGCSSCCSSGDNILYTFNNDGYVLTESDLTGSIIHEYQYDSQNRLINKWLGDKDNLRPVQVVIYDTNNASSYGGHEIQDIYDYIDGDNYNLTRNILIADGKVITQIQFDNLNVDSQNISTDPNTIIANGGYITTYEYLTNAVITKSPEFNAGLTNICRKQTFRSSGSGNEEDILISVDANNNETETVLSRNSYSDNLLTAQYSWYNLQLGGYSSNNYYNNRLSGYSQAGASQLNGYYTQAYNNYTYHPDGRLNTEQSGNSGDVDTMLITTSVYDDINHSAGTIVTDEDNNLLYETFLKSNGFGDVIYKIDRTGVAAGKEYDNGGKVISEFVFAEPNDTALFDNASFSDISSVYEDVSVVSQTKYFYDNKGRLTCTYTAVDDSIFDYNSPDSWNITAYGYDDYGRKTSQTVDVDGLALVTEYQYNNQGQLEKTIYPDSHWVKQIYNGRGFVEATIEGYGSESTDPNDFVITETVYNADGRVFKTIKGSIVTASFEYDELGSIYRQYQGDFETEYCNFVQFDRNDAGDVLNQKFVNVNSTTAVETVIQQIDYRYNGRGEKIEERVITDPNDEPEGISQSNDFTDRVRLFSYDHFGNTVEVVTKTDDANGIYTDINMNVVNCQAGDHIEQNYYNNTGELAYSIKFDGKETCYFDWMLQQNVCNVLIDFEDINDVLCYAKNTRDIYIVRYNYLDGKLDSTDVLADYNEAHPDFDDYQYHQNIDAGLVWKTSSAHEYDTAGRTVKSFDADDNFTTIKYNSLNLPTEQILWQGKGILRFSDSNGYDPSFIPYPVRTSLTAYNNLGSKTKTAVLYDTNSINDINGIDDVNLAVDNVISYVYDASGNLYRQKEALGTDSEGWDVYVLTEYSFDDLGRTEQILYGKLKEFIFGQTYSDKIALKYITYGYNNMGQMDTQTVTDVNTIDLETTVAFDTHYEYDNQGRVKEIQNASGILGQYFYDTIGRKVKEVDFAGMVTINNYNGLGYLTSTVEDANDQQRTTTFGYDRNGRRTSISSVNDSTIYTYNYLDKITNIEYPDDKEIAYGYNVEGNAIRRTITENSTSVTTNYKRDVLGRVCYKQYSNDPNWNDPNTFWPFDEILYDAAGNKWLMANIDDSNDSEFLCFTYDGFGNIVSSSESYPEMNYDVSYGYDTRGLLKTIQYPDDKIITYQRDALGRVETVSYDGQTIAQYYYLGDKVIKKMIGGIEYTANIDSLGRIESEGYGGLTFDYGYLTHTDRLTARNSVGYGYDTLGRVDSEESTSYYCDLLGNPTNAGNDGLTYTMDNEDRITEVADGSTAVAYYSYDRTGRRISKTVGETKTYFAYDKFGNVIAEYIRDGNETVWQKDYVYGANGELIYMQLPGIPASSGGEDLDDFIDFCNSWLCAPYCDSNDLVWDYDNNNNINFIDWAYHSADMNDVVITPYQINGKYILTDFHNSVVGISDGSSIVEIAYNAWGVPSYTGDLDGLNILWNGYYSDEETGNYYLRNRYYSPLERKFVTEDPRGINPDGNWNNRLSILSQYDNGVGLEVYAASDPINGRDDWGLRNICCKTKETYKNTVFIPYGMGLPGGNYTETKTSCSQNTISLGKGSASPMAACKCKYRNFPKIKVYGAHEGECCSCTITFRHSEFYYPTSHRKITINCTNGMEKTIDLSPFHDGNLGNVRIIDKEETIKDSQWPAGSITTSCEKVNDVISSITSVNWNLVGWGDSMNCIGFAWDLYNKFKQCP